MVALIFVLAGILLDTSSNAKIEGQIQISKHTFIVLKITDDNYNFYKQVFETLWLFKATRLRNIDPDVEYSPVIILTHWEKKSKTIAKRGLKETLPDMLTMFMDLSNDMKKELSEQLVSKGLPSFNQLVSTIKDTPQKVLKRGKIKSLDEYYIIKEFIDDQTSKISEADREQLDKIFWNFESHADKTKNAS